MPPAPPSAPPPAAEEPSEKARLLLVHLGRLVRQEVGVLQPVVYPVAVDVREVLAPPAGGLDQLLAELHALLGRQLREDVLGGLAVHVGGELRGDLFVARRRLLIGDRLRPLPEAIQVVVVVLLLRPAERVAPRVRRVVALAHPLDLPLLCLLALVLLPRERGAKHAESAPRGDRASPAAPIGYRRAVFGVTLD